MKGQLLRVLSGFRVRLGRLLRPKSSFLGHFVETFLGIMILDIAYETLWLQRSFQDWLVTAFFSHAAGIAIVSGLYAAADHWVLSRGVRERGNR